MQDVLDSAFAEAIAAQIAPRVLRHIGERSFDGRTSEAHNPDPEEYLSQRQFLEEYDISKTTAQRWRAAGLPYVKVGTVLFYRRQDVRDWLAQHRTKAA